MRPPRSRPAIPLVLRTKTTDDLAAYLDGSEPAEPPGSRPIASTKRPGFSGLRLNAGVDIAALEKEFGQERVLPALAVASRLAADGLLTLDQRRVRLTARGRLLSNEVFQEFLGLEAEVSS